MVIPAVDSSGTGRPRTPPSAHGASFHFPPGFSKREQELWQEVEERGPALSVALVEAIWEGNEVAHDFIAEKIRRNASMRCVLQGRLDELRTQEQCRSLRVNFSANQPLAAQHNQPAIGESQNGENSTSPRDGLQLAEGTRTFGGQSSHKVPRGLPHFRGTSREAIQEAIEFIDRFETIFEPHSLDDLQLMRVLPVCLDKVDGAWFKQWKTQNPQATWSDARRAFLAHFRHPNELTVLQAQIRALRMDTTGVQRYADQFRKLMVQLDWTSSTPAAIYQFKQGLTRWMLDRLSGAEANWALMAGLMGRTDTEVDVDALVSMALRIEADKNLSVAGESTRTTSSLGRSDTSGDWRRDKRECNYCRKPGHIERDCRKKEYDQRARDSHAKAAPSPFSRDSTGVKCYNCNETGHYATSCPRKRRTQEVAVKPTTPVAKSILVDEEADIDVRRVESGSEAKTAAPAAGEAANKRVACLRTPCYLEGQKVIAYVDGGANTSFVDRRWAVTNGLKIEPRSGTLTQFVDGATMPRIGVVPGVCLENGKKVLRVDLEVADLSGEEEVVIGIDLFEPLGFQVLGVPFSWPSRADSTVASMKKTATSAVLPPGVGEDGIADEWREVLGRNQAISVFALTSIPNSELHLPTGEHEPVYVRQYPIAEGLRSGVTERVDLWKMNGWVVPAPPGCRWNSPILAAKKSAKEVGEVDDIRVCIDSRALNERLVDDPDSRLPLVREVIDHLGPFQWITTLDLADSYHQFAIAEEDRPKLAFTWNGEQLMWRVAPFGVKTMPAHMQHQMEELLKPTKRTPFLDDLVIASETTEQHKKDVLEVLQVLTDNGRLRLKMKKCKFFKTEARILGFLINRDGVKMDPKKVKAIAEWPRPVDGKAMQRFMGAANFNREFSARFAELAAPLDSARSTKGAIEWTPEMERAFDALKNLFSSSMLLQRVDWDSTIYLTTDASLTGIGAWIGQKDGDGNILPCICVSKKLSPTQQRWSATKRELYALMWGMQKLRHYLIGRWFIARVDHRPLVNLVKNRMNFLLEGWMDTILQFNFTTEYLPGECNRCP